MTNGGVEEEGRERGHGKGVSGTETLDFHTRDSEAETEVPIGSVSGRMGRE